MHDREIVSTEHIEFDTIRWARVPVDCTGCSAIDEIHTLTGQTLASARAAEDPSRGLVARVVFEGETPFAAELADRKLQLRDDVRALATAVCADLWVEKLLVHTRAPKAAAVVEVSEDFLGLLAGAEADEALASQLTQDLAPMLTAVASDLGDPHPDDLRSAAQRVDWTRLVAEASGALRSRLSGVS